MGEIVQAYNRARASASDYQDRRVLDGILSDSYLNRSRPESRSHTWQRPDLETLASHLATSITGDDDVDSKQPRSTLSRILVSAYNLLDPVMRRIGLDRDQPTYALMNLFNIGRLQRRGIFKADENLGAIHHLIDDYLKPEDEQAYHLGEAGITAVLQKVLTLHLESRFDIDYIPAVLNVAERRGHHDIATLKTVRDQIQKTQTRGSKTAYTMT